MSIIQNAEMRTLDPVLTTLSQGYSNSNFVDDYLFPTVEVAKSKGRIPLFGKTAFLSRKVERATGASSNRIPLTQFNLLNYECRERDIEMAVDYLEEETSNDFYKFEQRTVRQLSDILALGRENEAASMATDPDNYSDDMKLILDDGEGFNSLSTDPTLVIENARESIRRKIGVYPNTMIIGNMVFKSLMNRFDFIEKYKYSGDIILTTAILSEMFSIPIVKIGQSVYS